MQIYYADLLKKKQYCQNNPKISHTKRKKLSTNFQDTHGVQYAHLIIQKINAIFIRERIVLKRASNRND